MIPRFRRGWLRALALTGIAAGGCATSDDPREGGLIGYWKHGEAGYQARLDRRREEVESAESQAEAARGETRALEDQLDVSRREVAEQRERLNELRDEIRQLEEALAAPPADLEQAPEMDALQQKVGVLDLEVRALDADTSLEIQERRRRIGELKKELKMLRERASLLTTL